MKNPGTSISKINLLSAYFLQHVQAVRAAFSQLSFSPLSTLMTFIVIGISFALPLGLFVIFKNVSGLSSGLKGTAQISLYLKKQATRGEVEDVINLIKKDNSVQSFRYISPEEGLKSFEGRLGLDTVLKTFKENPLPSVIVITPIERDRTTLGVKQLLYRLKQLPNIETAQLDMAWMARLFAMIDVAHRLIVALMILFALAVLFIVGNTIRLMLQNHRDEIVVMKLLGATDAFIRRPFLYNGIICGISGAILAWFLVDFGMFWLNGPVEHLANLYAGQFSLQGLSSGITLMLLFGGAFLGYVGAFMATARQVRN